MHLRMALFVKCSCIERHHVPVAKVPDEGGVLSVMNMLTAIVTMHPCTGYMKIEWLPDCSTSQKPYCIALCPSLFVVTIVTVTTLPAKTRSSLLVQFEAEGRNSVQGFIKA